MSNELLIIIAASELISFICMLRIVRSESAMGLKILSSVLVFIPIIGPAMYLFTTQAPPINRYKHRRQTLRSIGSYESDFDYDTKAVQERTNKLKSRLENQDEN